MPRLITPERQTDTDRQKRIEEIGTRWLGAQKADNAAKLTGFLASEDQLQQEQAGTVLQGWQWDEEHKHDDALSAYYQQLAERARKLMKKKESDKALLLQATAGAAAGLGLGPGFPPHQCKTLLQNEWFESKQEALSCASYRFHKWALPQYTMGGLTEKVDAWLAEEAYTSYMGYKSCFGKSAADKHERITLGVVPRDCWWGDTPSFTSVWLDSYKTGELPIELPVRPVLRFENQDGSSTIMSCPKNPESGGLWVFPQADDSQQPSNCNLASIMYSHNYSDFFLLGLSGELPWLLITNCQFYCKLCVAAYKLDLSLSPGETEEDALRLWIEEHLLPIAAYFP